MKVKASRSICCYCAVLLALSLASVAARATNPEKLVYSFTGSDGKTPLHGGLLYKNGKLYGVTSSGGTSNQGVVFELARSGGNWVETVLYDFSGGSDGGDPNGTLVMDEAGNLYGTALIGGTSGTGVVFELTPSQETWSERVIYNFVDFANGVTPFGGVSLDQAGNLYGTTEAGGLEHCPPSLPSCGVVYQLTPSGNTWMETVLYRFTGQADGALPLAGVTLDVHGNVYGTTEYGGAGVGFGVVFELTNQNGNWTETVIHAFTDTDGGFPLGGVTFDKNGNLYGTTAEGGTSFDGTIFELSPSAGGGWTENVLYSFKGGSDGLFPEGDLTLDGKGSIFGNTTQGGTGNCPDAFMHTCGTIFELTPSSGSWTKTELYEFHGRTDGGTPYGGMVFDRFGNLFGIGAAGGSNGDGAVFEVKP